ncbi:MAG: hypothetical protein QM820_25805 [Minicystis sp.]
MIDRPLLRASRGAYAAIALVSAAVLLFEVAVTRVLSVVLWYHFAFLAISLAMLGLGLPGVWFTLRRPGRAALPIALLAAAIVVPGSIVVLFRAGEIVTKAQHAAPDLGVFAQGGMLLVLACVLAPFLALGSAVCLLLVRAEGRLVGRMYAADLLGATAGALAIVPLLNVVPTPLVIAGAGLLPLIAAALVVEGSTRRITRSLAAVIAVALIGAMIWGEPFRLRASKSYVEPEDLLFVKWTPTARITIFPDIFYLEDKEAGFGWGMGSKYRPVPIEQLWIEQDASAGTPITRLTGSPADLHHLLFDVTSAGYQLRPARRACVIGGGGGRDILTALAAGATDVDAVELNPHIVAALSGPFKAFSGDVYHLPGVHAHVGEGRSFLTHARGDYDLIQISLIDSWAATAAGAFALSENYLYTVDALRLYWRRAAKDGIVSISRWMWGDRQLEGGRLANLAVEALRLEGVPDPRKHIAVVQAWSVGTFLLSKAPFDAAAIRKLDSICATRGFRRHWPRTSDTPGDSIVASVLADGTAAYEERGVDLSPSTDDRPFFFQTLRLFGGVDRAFLATLSNNEHSVAMLRTLLGVVTVATLALFFLPFLFRGRVSTAGRFAPGLWLGSGYFSAIGVAFMLIEVPWMQRFVLYLGHPSYATTVVLAALLLGAGAGSFAAARVDLAALRRFGPALPALLLVQNLVLGPVFAATLGLDFPVRVILSVLLLAPAGFLMGFPFAAGMTAFGDAHKPWFWAMNGSASVLASVCSLAVSMSFGFTRAAVVGAGFYLIAYLLFVWQTRSASAPEGAVG